jgi:hypothetical protein
LTSKDSRSRKQREVEELTVPVNIGSDHIQGSINNAPITLDLAYLQIIIFSKAIYFFRLCFE